MNVTAGNLLKNLKNRLRLFEQGQIVGSEEIVRYTKDTIHLLESRNPLGVLVLHTEMSVSTHHRRAHVASGGTVGR